MKTPTVKCTGCGLVQEVDKSKGIWNERGEIVLLTFWECTECACMECTCHDPPTTAPPDRVDAARRMVDGMRGG